MGRSFAAGNGGEPDGVYGEETRLGVIQFQKRAFPANALEWDGRVGPVTLKRLDGELESRPRAPRTLPVDPAAKRRFTFRSLQTPLVIKKQDDPLPPLPAAQDLEFGRVNRISAEIRARALAPGTETLAKAALLAFLSGGGANPRELGLFFLSNRHAPPGFIRQLGKGDFWSTQVAGDKAFVANHERLVIALQEGLQDLASKAPAGADIDVSQLQEGEGQPEPLRKFATGITFAFQENPARLAGDPLAFGIGSIQGIEVRISTFFGQPDGSYRGTLSYDLLDHFGSNDSDVIDPGQASLWLLQRKLYPFQDKSAFMPYRIRITVDDVPFSGKLQ